MSKIDSIRLDGTQYDIERGMLPEVVNELPATGEEDTMYLVGEESSRAIRERGHAIAISGSDASNIELLKIYGGTLQNGTPTPSAPVPISAVTGSNYVVSNSKNLLDASVIFAWQSTYAESGNGYQISGDNNAGVHYITIPITRARDLYGETLSLSYTYSGDITQVSIYALNSLGEPTDVIVRTHNTGDSFAMPDRSSSYDGVGIVVYVSANGNGIIRDMQIELDAPTGSYSPYSSSYQEINLGKNLFNKTNVASLDGYPSATTITSDNYHKTIYIKCEPNTTYTVQKINQGNNKRFALATTATLPAIGGSTLQFDQNNNADSMTITTSSSARYLLVWCYVTSDTGVTWNEIINSLQIENGSQASSYASYFNPIKLCQIGKYQDLIYKSGDDWYIHEEIGKYTFTSSETGTYQSSFPRFMINFSHGQDPANSAKSLAKCSYLTVGQTASVDGTFGIGSGVIYIRNEGCTSVSELNTWFRDNIVTVIFPLLTPTDTKITNQELISQLEHSYSMVMSSNSPVSLFSSRVENNYSAEIEVVYSDTAASSNKYTEYVWNNSSSEYELVGPSGEAPNSSASTPFTVVGAGYSKAVKTISGGTYGASGVQQLYVYSSKNLLDMSSLARGYIGADGMPVLDCSNGEMYSGFIKVKPNTQYTFSIQKTVTNYTKWMCISQYSGPNMVYTVGPSQTSHISRTVVNNASSMTLTTGPSTQFIVVSARNLLSATEVQVEESSTMTPYVPYAGGVRKFDLFTENLLDDNTPILFEGYIKNNGEVVAANNYWSLSIPCDPDTTYIACLDEDLTDGTAMRNVLKVASYSAPLSNGITVSDLNNSADGTRGYAISHTTTASAQYLVCFFAEYTGKVEDALKRLRIYKASDAIDLSGGKEIVHSGDSFVYDGNAIANKALISQLESVCTDSIDMRGISAASVYAVDGSPAIITIDYWDEYTHADPDVSIIKTMRGEIERLQRLVDYDKTVKGINHRGYSIEAPENTLPAYKLSKKMGFNYAETDVSFTSDGVAVCLHDDTINRTSNGTGIIYNMTYADVLQYDFGSWKSPVYAGTKIPTVEQFVKLCKDIGLNPYIELKDGYAYTESQIQSIVDIVKACGMSKNTTFISFNSTFLTYVKNYDQEARIGFIAGIDASSIATANSLKTGYNEVVLDVQYNVATQANIDLCIAADIPVEVWTVDSDATILKLNKYVTGVTSNYLIAGKVLYDANI